MPGSHGGTRKGAGRKPLPDPDQRRILRAVRLPADVDRTIQSYQATHALPNYTEALVALIKEADHAVNRQTLVDIYNRHLANAEDETLPLAQRVGAALQATSYARDARLHSPVSEAGDWVRRIEDMESMGRELRERI